MIETTTDKPPVYVGAKVGMTMEEMIYRLVMATLDDCGGNKRKAGSILGITARTVRRWSLKELDTT
jgi:DNA-binding protein Fis